MYKIAILALILAFNLGGAVKVFAAEVTLRVHHFLGPESLTQTKLLKPWALRVEKASKGRIKVEIHPDMKLGGKAWDLVDQVSKGTVDMVWTAAAYTPGRFRNTEVFSLPIVHQGDAVATNLAIRELLTQELRDDFKGLYPLLVHVHAGHVFHMASKSINKIDDFKGMALRPPGRRGVGRWTIEALGASPTKKRHPKLPKALKEQKLDGALMSFRLADSMGVIDAVSSHTLYGEGGSFGTSLYLFLMNKKRYEALPDDLKIIIDEQSGKDFAKEIGQTWQQGSVDGQAAAKKHGSKIIVLDKKVREAVNAKQLEVLSLWAKQYDRKGITGLELMEKARKAVKRNLKK
ncbi:MAG: TRAP transporter substrate-binding protein [bacterium]|nr:TRAP transporter substrate-binding protein [bacterium]